MARPKGRPDLRPAIAGGLTRALKIMENSGKPISTVWTDMFEQDPVNAMRLAISLLPKEMDITTTDLTPEQWLERMSDVGQSESTEPADTVPGSVH